VVLVALGGVVKNVLDNSIYTRLQYTKPGVNQQCWRDTVAAFDDEYYLFNLTNPTEFLAGSKPVFNMTGPFSYAQWYCYTNFTVDDTLGFVSFEYSSEGYMFLEDYSSAPDTSLITNINPAYLGILAQTGGEQGLLIVVSSGVIEQIITEFQAPTTIELVELSAVQQVFATTNSRIVAALLPNLVPAFATGAYLTFKVQLGYTPPQIFGSLFQVSGFPGWGYYTLAQDGSANVTIADSTADALFAAWTADPTYGTGFTTFAQLPAATIENLYNVTAAQAATLVAYVDFLLTTDNLYAPGLNAQAQSLMQSAWANKTVLPGLPSGWALPVASGLSAHDTATIFGNDVECSIAGAAGYQNWLAALQDPTNVALSMLAKTGCGWTMDATQYEEILEWIGTYAVSVAGPEFLAQFGLANWDDFAYAQWGQLVAGESLGPPAGLHFSPEIAAFTGPDIPASCVNYTAAEARALLNGTLPLFNYEYMVLFFELAEAESFTTIAQYWPGVTEQKAVCFTEYVQQILIHYEAEPRVQAAIGAGSGLVVTRTVSDWLFNAQDPLLTLLEKPNNTALIGNLTISPEQAKINNDTYYRIYTGHNDLYWSLMPYNDGIELEGWRGNITINGYNGSQFLPNGAIDDPTPGGHPLNLWNKLIARPIPFIKAGGDSWEGVTVRYLTLNLTSVANQVINPDNEAYYAVYSGLINQTSLPPYLPLFLSLPDFHYSEDAVTENITLIDNIFDWDPNANLPTDRLSLFLLVEPTLGTSVWGNLPIQANLQYGATDLFYTGIEYPGFAPIFWSAIGSKATDSQLDDIKTQLYGAEMLWKLLIGIGAGVGTSIAIVGAAFFYHYKKHENEVKDVRLESSSTSVRSVAAFNPSSEDA